MAPAGPPGQKPKGGNVKTKCYYIAESGLARRLLEAENLDDAHVQFLNDLPRRRHMQLDVSIREATDDELLEFGKRKPRYDGQEVLFGGVVE